MVALAQNAALFDYNHTVPFQYQEDIFKKDARIEVAGAGFQLTSTVLINDPGKGPGPRGSTTSKLTLPP
jgi:hypothetical protein